MEQIDTNLKSSKTVYFDMNRLKVSETVHNRLKTLTYLKDWHYPALLRILRCILYTMEPQSNFLHR
jgi:hypothetical protein